MTGLLLYFRVKEDKGASCKFYLKGKKDVSKYTPLWEYVKKCGSPSLQMTFEEIKNITGLPIDHAFLRYKKELTDYGYQVGKISLKEQTVTFQRLT